MNAMEELVKEFEGRLRDYVGTAMPKFVPVNARTSYTVQFTTVDKSGTIFIMATDDNALVIAFHKGTAPSEYSEICTSPYIYNALEAKGALMLIIDIIVESIYEGLNVSIEEYIERIKNLHALYVDCGVWV